MIVRDAMRTAALTSSPNLVPPPPPTAANEIVAAQVRFGGSTDTHATVAPQPRVLCCEEIDGKRWNYVVDAEGPRMTRRGSSLKAVSLQSPVPPIDVS